jgi:hypothetical protein
MPHIIHLAVAGVSALIFTFLATMFSLAEIELNPISRNLLGTPHTKWVASAHAESCNEHHLETLLHR